MNIDQIKGTDLTKLKEIAREMMRVIASRVNVPKEGDNSSGSGTGDAETGKLKQLAELIIMLDKHEPNEGDDTLAAVFLEESDILAIQHFIERQRNIPVIPAQAGIPLDACASGKRDSRLRGNDDKDESEDDN